MWVLSQFCEQCAFVSGAVAKPCPLFTLFFLVIVAICILTGFPFEFLENKKTQLNFMLVMLLCCSNYFLFLSM